MKLAVVLLAGTLGSGPAFAQSIGANLAGFVTDETGARLENATVTITQTLSGRAVVVSTGSEGEYRAVALLPGEYDIAAARSGFSSVTRRVALPVGADATLNLTLPLAGVVEQTTVNADAPLVEVARSQPSSVVTRQDIDTLPLLDRNFLVLAQLLPGSGPINSTVTRLATTKFGGVADQRAGYTTLIDGGDINDTVWGSPTINVGEEAVQEFKVFRHQFDAQYGHALNAVVTVATRSGTNRFAGSGFYFGRDDALNARYPFAAENPPFDKQRVGGSIGGPLIRDRSHFFASYERENADTVRVVALPPNNPFATRENGVFPAEADSHMASARLDHRFGVGHFFSARYASDNQKSLRANAGGSDSSQVDILNRSHSLVVEDTWSMTQSVAHAFRVHVLNHTLGTFPRDASLAIRRPSVTRGVTNPDAWVVPVTRVTVSNALYLHTSRSDFKVGGEMALGTHDQDSHVYENGFFEFQTDAPFDSANPATWPTAYNQQKPVTVTYRSQEFGLFAQNDWRLGNRMRLNAGLRYDIDLNLRLNDFYGRQLDDPNFQGLDRFISRDRGTDTNNLQPRLGATWDSRGDGTLIVRGGWGVYVTRNRPWIQIRSMNQFASSAVRITDPDATAALPRYRRGPRRPHAGRVSGRCWRAEARHGDSGRFRSAIRVEHDDWRRMAGESNDHARRRLHPFVCEPSDRLDRREPSAERRDLCRQSASRCELQPGDDGRELHQELVRRRRNAVAIADRVARFIAGVLHAVAQLSRWRRLLHDDARDAADATRARLQPVGSAPQPDGRRHGGFAVVHSGEWNPEAD